MVVEAPTIAQIQQAPPEGLMHFLSQLPASFEAELLYALMLSGLVGILANYSKKWARGEIQGGLIHYLFVDNVRGTWLSVCTIIGLAVTAISNDIFLACPRAACSASELLFVGWKSVMWQGVASGFVSDALANNASPARVGPVWSPDERSVKLQGEAQMTGSQEPKHGD